MHEPRDLFSGGVLYTLVKIYALGVMMMAAIAAPMLVILRSDNIPWSRLPSAIGQLWAVHDESEDEGELPNNVCSFLLCFRELVLKIIQWIDLVFSTASFSVYPGSEERMVASPKEARISTDDTHYTTNHVSF